MAKMNPEIKARWVAALRSGKYAQCKAGLHEKDGGFCCLGVLTDLAVQSGIGEWSAPDKDESPYMAFGDDTGLLPSAVAEWAGFNYPARMGGEVSIGDEMNMLAAHNDLGRTFAEIADAIEEQM